MDSSYYLCANKAIKSQKCEKVIEEKNLSPKTNFDMINKNLITNDNHSNTSGIIEKAKKINIESINSLYILKEIFSLLSEKLKLEIIIYNKDLQNKLDINIENYKKIRGIYREVEKDGKGEEYNISNGELIFEGEYKNGKRNGKGIKYYNDELIFEGKYKNGKRNGKGKEYYNDELIFEGEYINGKRWNGKGYNK